jgi:hypothetical protein
MVRPREPSARWKSACAPVTTARGWNVSRDDAAARAQHTTELTRGFAEIGRTCQSNATRDEIDAAVIDGEPPEGVHMELGRQPFGSRALEHRL